MRFILTFVMLTLYGFGFNYHLEATKITDGVACFFGLHGDADEINGGRVVNSCYVETSEGYLVIDSGPTYSFAQQAYTMMQEQKVMPVKYVINTSADELQILGNEFYKEQGATLIGPQSYEKLIGDKKPLALLEKLSGSITHNTRLVPLDRYQNSDMTLILGKTTVEIKSFEEHNTANLVVYLPTQRTIFAGNYINSSKTPTWTQHSNPSWEKALAMIGKSSWDHLIPAHGVKHRKDKGVLKQTTDYFASLQPKKAKTEVRLVKQDVTPKKPIKAKSEESVKKVAQTKQNEEMRLAKSMIKSHKNAQSVRSDQSCPAHITYQPSYDIAKRQAKLEHKYLLVKIETNGCQPCKELNRVLETNCNIKKIINNHTKAIKINTSYDEVPEGYNNMGTPALFLVQPESQKIVMHLEGRIDAQDLEESLKLFTNSGLAMR